jgi:NADPH:quinone reductase
MNAHITTRVVRFYVPGDASVLKIGTIPLPKPAAGEVRLRVEMIGLNRAEIMFRNNAYRYAPNSPSTLGYEAAGFIDALSEDVVDFKVGETVSTIPAFSM